MGDEQPAVDTTVTHTIIVPDVDGKGALVLGMVDGILTASVMQDPGAAPRHMTLDALEAAVVALRAAATAA